MTLSSIKMVTELNYWIYQYIMESSLNKYDFKIPSYIKDIYLNEKTFIELLFNEDYSDSEYLYLFDENTSNSTWPSDIKNRLMLYPLSSQYYEITDSTSGENLFLLESDDIVLLDSLLSYRNNPDTTIITDSTSETLFDLSTKTLSTNYNILNTNLSKLIFIYLKFKIDNDFSIYGDLSTTISDSDNILECFYESFIVDKLFIYLSAQSVL